MFYTQQLLWFNSKFPLLSLTEEQNALALFESAVLKEESHDINLRTGWLCMQQDGSTPLSLRGWWMAQQTMMDTYSSGFILLNFDLECNTVLGFLKCPHCNNTNNLKLFGIECCRNLKYQNFWLKIMSFHTWKPNMLSYLWCYKMNDQHNSALSMHMLNLAELISITVQNISAPLLACRLNVFLSLPSCC